MKTIREFLEEQINEQLIQAVVSGRRTGEGPSKVKLRPVELKGQIFYQASMTEGTKVYHKNFTREEMIAYLEHAMEEFRQLQATGRSQDGSILISKKGKATIKTKQHGPAQNEKIKIAPHNRVKQYILREGTAAPFLVDLGDIAGYEGVSSVDMVVTLHACDTATDFALAKAVEWGAQVILSVPCCQHELNRQIRNEMLQPVMRYGILKERMAALITDGLRAELLESKGYETQLLEFIDMEHTPKNILIRAVKTGKKKSRDSFSDTMKALHVAPTLDRLLYPEESASQKGE